MPLRLELGQYWLTRRQLGRAREQMIELCRLAATSGERTYLALGHHRLPEAAFARRDLPAAERELSAALYAVDGYEVPLAEWRICATAARPELMHGRRPKADAYWTRSAAGARIHLSPPTIPPEAGDGATAVVYEVAPRRAFGLRKGKYSRTRWRF